VDTKDCLGDNGSKRKIIKNLAEKLPNLKIQLRRTLLSKTEDGSHVHGLVVPTKKVYVIRIPELEGKKKANHFNRFRAAIDVVAEEEPRAVGGKARRVKRTEQIRKLAMNISANMDRCPQSKDGWIKKEDGTHIVAQPLRIGDRKFEIAPLVLDVGSENGVDAFSCVHYARQFSIFWGDNT
jgi:hypothetical protein